MKTKILKKFVVLAAVVGMLSTSIVANAEESYTVKTGDNLKKIAKQVYGDSSQWESIYEANKATIKNPKIIYAGQVLTIPSGAEQTPAVAEETAPVSTETVAEISVETVTETPAPAPTEAVAETPAPVQEEVAEEAPIQSVPVGNNPVIDQNGWETWTFADGTYLTATKDDGYNVVTEKDAYGITYRCLTSELSNAEAMKGVAAFMQDPNNAQAAETIKEFSNSIIITSCMGLWDDTYDYGWNANVVDCEPYENIYIFVSIAHDENAWSESLSFTKELFDYYTN